MPVGANEADALAEALDEFADALVWKREEVGARIGVGVDEVESSLLRRREDAIAGALEAAELCA